MDTLFLSSSNHGRYAGGAGTAVNLAMVGVRARLVVKGELERAVLSQDAAVKCAIVGRYRMLLPGTKKVMSTMLLPMGGE